MYLINTEIEKIKLFFKTKPVLKAYIFGSYSRGDATSNSDIDLLLDLDYSQPVGFEFIEMKQELELLLGKRIDLVSSRGISKYLLPIIEKEKKEIYAR